MYQFIILISSLAIFWILRKLIFYKYYTYIFFVVCIFVPFIPLVIFALTNIWIFEDYTFWTNELFDPNNSLKVLKHLSLIYLVVSLACIVPLINLKKLFSNGFLSFNFVKQKDILKKNKSNYKSTYKINLFSQYLILFFVVLISILSICFGYSTETILKQSYDDVLSTSTYSDRNTAVTTLLFYLQSILVYSTCLFGLSLNKKSTKFFGNIIILITLFWAVFVDLSQGDRTSFGFIISLISITLYFNKIKGSNHPFSLSPKTAISIFSIVISLAYFLGVVRVVGYQTMINSPYTVLKLAGSYTVLALPSNSGFRQLIGQAIYFDGIDFTDAFNLINSHLMLIFPSFLRNIIGYDSSLGFYDTNLYKSFTNGGSNLTILPFEIGGYLLVFAVVFLFCYSILFFEKKLEKTNGIFYLVVLVLFISFTPRLAWYGYGYLAKFVSLIIPVFFIIRLMFNKK